MADFGQTDFGQPFDTLWPIVSLTDFGQTVFGQFWCFVVLTDFGQTDFANFSVLVFWPNFLNPKCPNPKTQTLNLGRGSRPFGAPPFGHARIWPKPHSAKKIRIWPICFRDCIWPNRIWPELVFQSVDRIWPNRIWPILVL